MVVYWFKKQLNTFEIWGFVGVKVVLKIFNLLFYVCVLFLSFYAELWLRFCCNSHCFGDFFLWRRVNQNLKAARWKSWAMPTAPTPVRMYSRKVRVMRTMALPLVSQVRHGSSAPLLRVNAWASRPIWRHYVVLRWIPRLPRGFLCSLRVASLFLLLRLEFSPFALENTRIIKERVIFLDGAAHHHTLVGKTVV